MPSLKCGLPPSRSASGQNSTYLPGLVNVIGTTCSSPPSSTALCVNDDRSANGGGPLLSSPWRICAFVGFPLLMRTAIMRWIASSPLLTNFNWLSPLLTGPSTSHLYLSFDGFAPVIVVSVDGRSPSLPLFTVNFA